MLIPQFNKRTRQLMVTAVNLLLFPIVLLSIVLTFPLSLVIRFQALKNYYFIIGLEHIVSKTLDRGSIVTSLGFTPVYSALLLNTSLHPRRLRSCSHDHSFYTSSAIDLIDFFSFLFYLFRFRPTACEIYTGHLGHRAFFYSVVLRLCNILSIMIFRGSETYYLNAIFRISSTPSLSFPKQLFYLSRYIFCFSAALFSRVSLLREYHMLNWFPLSWFKSKKVLFDYNKIDPVPSVVSSSNGPNILYLNSVRYPLRRVDILIEAFSRLQSCLPSARLTIVGCRTNDEIALVKSWVNQYSFSTPPHIYPWSNESSIHYASNSIFILPSNHIFCNFSLLEAMRAKLACIVCGDKYASRIITHNINGLVCSLDPSSLCEAMHLLCVNHPLRASLGEQASTTIYNKFNSIHRKQLLSKVISSFTSAR